MGSYEANKTFPDSKQRAAFCYSQWRRKNSVDGNEEPQYNVEMPGEIRNLEIFGAGTHRAQTGKITVTEADLDQIVNAFNELNGTNVVKPHLKLGHTDAQKWFGQKDGIPSLGWISRVWRQGTKLLADVVDVPSSVLDLIKQGRYHNVSAEVFWDANIKHNDRKYPRVLSAVSLLGVEMPAVKDLAGLAAALFQSEPIHQFAGEEPTSIEPFEQQEKDNIMPEENKGMFSQSQLDSLIAAAVAKAVDEAKVEFASEIDELKNQIKSKDAELEVMKNRAETAEGEVKTVKAAAIKSEAETLVNQAIKDGKLLPKQKDFAMAALTAQNTKVAFGADNEEKSMPELFKDFLNAQGKQVDLSENGDGTNKVKEFSTAAEELDHEIKQFMAKSESEITYGDAMDKVLASNSDLKQRYLEAQV